MPPVAVRILHPPPDPAAGPLVGWVAEARGEVAERHRRGFERAGADDVLVLSGPADGRPFGDRLRDLIGATVGGGLVVLGSGSMPLATLVDRRAFVTAAESAKPRALTNNQYSSDAIAIARVDQLSDVPNLPSDNALPRWLAEVAGYEVTDLRRRWRLAIDIDGPLDAVLASGCDEAESADRLGIDLGPTDSRLRAVRQAGRDPRAELLIAGRTSAATLAWLEAHTASRTRALIEERGLRASDGANRRPPASILGALLERDGPESLGDNLARLSDAALVDTRVLLAHRLGPDEAAWPAAEDRFASDLLLADRISDPWLRALTESAAAAPIPVVLGGHTLVGPGVRLIMGRIWS